MSSRRGQVQVRYTNKAALNATQGMILNPRNYPVNCRHTQPISPASGHPMDRVRRKNEGWVRRLRCASVRRKSGAPCTTGAMVYGTALFTAPRWNHDGTRVEPDGTVESFHTLASAAGRHLNHPAMRRYELP